MKTASRRRAAICASLAFLVTGASWAGAEDTARQILDRREALDEGPRWWSDRYQRMKVTVEDEGHKARHLELEAYDLRQHGRHQKSLVIFSSPAEKAGIALLGHTEGGKPASQWLYTPATRRVRQIANNVRMNRFDITDFTYHDLDVLTDLPHWKEDDARSSLQKPETVDGVSCYVIDLEPRLEHVAYYRIRLWLGRDDLVARQVELYEKPPARGLVASLFGTGSAKDDQPVRRFRQKDIRNVGAVPVAYRIEVESPAQHSRTIIDVADVGFNRGLTDPFFSPGSLETKSR